MTDLATQQPDFFDHYRKLGRRLLKRTAGASVYAPPSDEESLVSKLLDESATAPIAPSIESEAPTVSCDVPAEEAPAADPSVTKRILTRGAPLDSNDHEAEEKLIASLRRRSRCADEECEPESTAISEEAAVGTEPEAAAEPMELPALRVADVEAPLEGVEDIYHNLRALVRTSTPARLVFAGASEGDGVRSIVVGIAEHAAQRGQRVIMAELLDPSGRTLLVRLATPGCGASSAPLLELDLHAADARERIGQWLTRELPETDLLLIVGPSLADSVDAALLASACDGLVIVAESGVTDRHDLATAAERARITNSPTLGVVVDGSRDRLPAWLRRWFGGRRQSLTLTEAQ